MASTKVLLFKGKNNRKSDGSYPLTIRITKNRRAKYIFLGVHILEKDWDEKNMAVKKAHPNSTHINNLVAKKISKANDLILEADANDKEVFVSQIKKTINRGVSSISFFALAEDRYNDYKKLGKYNVAEADNSKIKNFKEFLNNEDIKFSEISIGLLEKFRTHLASYKELSPRTIANHLLLIRTLFNTAITDGQVDAKFYPFGKGKIQIKIPESLKIGLDEEEITRIRALDLPEASNLFHARNKWLFSFYFAGMRISDVLKTRWSDFSDNRLNYRMGKNQKILSVKIPDKVLEILDYYKKDKKGKNDFIFPDMKTADLNDKMDVYRKLNTAIKNTNDHLKKLAVKANIEKKLTNHIARHTFGNIAGDQISPQMLQKLYRHSDIRTTMGYQANFIHKSADEALDSVINF